MGLKIKSFAVLSVVLVLVFAGGASAGLNETLPTYHWAYRHIEELRVRDFLGGLHMARKPFTRGEVALELNNLLDEGWRMDDMRKAGWLLDELFAEFAPEMDELRSNNGGHSAEGENNSLSLGLLVQDGYRTTSDKNEGTQSYRVKGGLNAGEHVAFYNTMNLDADLTDDTTFVGRAWRDMAGYTEQAYIRFEGGRFSVVAGRDFQRWGVGRRGTLLLSDYSRPLDHLSAGLEAGPLYFTFLLAELDRSTGSRQVAVVGGHGGYRRYISAHRLDLRIGESLSIGIAELSIYARFNDSPPAVFLNPVIFFHGEQINNEEQANSFGTLDLLWYPGRTWRVAAALLIDDVQLDNKTREDLEPDEIGFILGLSRANPFGMDGIDVWGEYVRVTNRTYRTPNVEETFLHRNRPIGYYLGNDFDSREFGASAWLWRGFQLSTSLLIVRDGEGGIYKPFDTPWHDYTVEEGYDEPFPTGVVQEVTSWEVKLEQRLSRSIRLRLEYENKRYNNAGHVDGAKDTENRFFIGFWWDLVYNRGIGGQ